MGEFLLVERQNTGIVFCKLATKELDFTSLLWPASRETFLPGQQRSVVTSTKVMPVFSNKPAFAPGNLQH